MHANAIRNQITSASAVLGLLQISTFDRHTIGVAICSVYTSCSGAEDVCLVMDRSCRSSVLLRLTL
jgi:hypothetical protein